MIENRSQVGKLVVANGLIKPVATLLLLPCDFTSVIGSRYFLMVAFS